MLAHQRTARLLTILLLACAMLFASGCIGRGNRVVYIQPGDPVRLREAIDAKVWVFDKDGELIESEMEIPEGWYCLPDPGEE